METTESPIVVGAFQVPSNAKMLMSSAKAM